MHFYRWLADKINNNCHWTIVFFSVRCFITVYIVSASISLCVYISKSHEFCDSQWMNLDFRLCAIFPNKSSLCNLSKKNKIPVSHHTKFNQNFRYWNSICARQIWPNVVAIRKWNNLPMCCAQYRRRMMIKYQKKWTPKSALESERKKKPLWSSLNIL